MKDLISNLREKILSEIKNSVDKNALEELRIKYLGKKVNLLVFLEIWQMFQKKKDRK